LLSGYAAMQPEEIEMLQRVYKSILKEEWFDRTRENERDFARSIISMFQQGMTDEDRLFIESLSVARAKYCRVVPAVLP
jgi:hypothetical protein